jgi:hypothetical protein
MELMGAVAEKSATTRTGDVTVLELGETMVTLCVKAKSEEIRNTNSAKMRVIGDTRILQLFLHAQRIAKLTNVSLH